MLVAVVFIHKLPQRDSHRLTLHTSVRPINSLELFRELLDGACKLLDSADIVCSTE